MDDDPNQVLKAIVDADALIRVSPTYFLGSNALLKLFLDRGLFFYAHIDRMWGTPTVGVGIAGIRGKEGYTRLGIQSVLKRLLADVTAVRTVYGALPGEVFLSKGNMALASALGKAIFGGHAGTLRPSMPALWR